MLPGNGQGNVNGNTGNNNMGGFQAQAQAPTGEFSDDDIGLLNDYNQ